MHNKINLFIAGAPSSFIDRNGLYIFLQHIIIDVSSCTTDFDSSGSGFGNSGEFVPSLHPTMSGSGLPSSSGSGSGLPISGSGSGLPSSSGSGLPISGSGSGLPSSSGSGLSISGSGSGLPSSSGSGLPISGSGSGLPVSSGSGGCGSGSGSAESGSTIDPCSLSGSGSGNGKIFTKSALLEASIEDGGIKCSDAGQYECTAGLDKQLVTVSIDINITIMGELYCSCT